MPVILGCVQLDGGHNFTQRDLDEDRVRYEHSVGFDGESASDEFIFCLSDGINSSPSEAFVIRVSDRKPIEKNSATS